MPQAEARAVQRLFTTDTQTRNAFSGKPHLKDIFAEIENTPHYDIELLKKKDGRTRLGLPMTDPHGFVIGYMSISVVRNALRTKHERKYVWKSRLTKDVLVSGVFVRKLVVHKNARNEGLGSILFEQARVLARELALHVYCDTKAENVGMRRFLRHEGCQENIFWHTESGTLMVRYILL